MSFLRHILLTYRLLPGQIIRLDAQLYGQIEDAAAAKQRTADEFIIATLHAAIQADRAQTAYERAWYDLTPREQQVAACICLGYTNQEIGLELTISINTVRSHVHNILEKFRVSSKTELRLALADWNFEE